MEKQEPGRICIIFANNKCRFETYARVPRAFNFAVRPPPRICPLLPARKPIFVSSPPSPQSLTPPHPGIGPLAVVLLKSEALCHPRYPSSPPRSLPAEPPPPDPPTPKTENAERSHFH